MNLDKFFSRSGEYASYQMFSFEHAILVLFSAVVVFFLFYKSKNCIEKDNVTAVIKRCTIIMWCMEIVKIVFNISNGNVENINTYVPLYYCSIPLYCGLGSAYTKGKFKHLCDVFLIVGGITGGIAYIIFPTTTAGGYPTIHMITMQSFIHHSIMVYLSFLLIKTNYVELNMRDIKYYSIVVITASIIALVVNSVFSSNLMFVSDYFSGTATEILYRLCPEMYSVMITLIQAFPPYFIVYGCVKIYNAHKKELVKES
ncbi:MAG: YwaF family protein [Oscillospiraceae bacterium]|nr:YwaF family protein [Oscillospiraceae bacterium]